MSDDSAADDSVNTDDTLDDTGDDTTDYSLDLEPFPGDASHYGIICGDGFAYLLGEDGFAESEDLNGTYWRCSAFDRSIYFLLRSVSVDETVDLYEDGTVTDLGLSQNLAPVGEKNMPFVFFSKDVGYVGNNEYDHGTWTDLGFNNWDVRAHDDGIVIAEDNCLYSWDGSNLTQIACAEDHPLNEDSEDFYRFNSVRYLGSDKIWVAMASYDIAPVYFSLWNGSGWTSTLKAMDASECPQVFWRVRPPDVGFAMVEECWSDKSETKEIFDINYFRLEGNAWTQIDGPEPKPGNRRETCSRLSATSQDEAWFYCIHSFLPSEEYTNDSPAEAYLAQWTDGVWHYWNFDYPDWPRVYDMDIRVAP